MRTLLVLIGLALFASCDKESDALVPQQQQPVIKDSTIALPVNFITTDYIELSKIERISKFRSGIGHDYRDGAESCRSMKHYYQPMADISWSSVKIFSPVSGTVVRKFDEWAGTQLWIRPSQYTAYTIIIFHIALLRPLAEGDSVSAGEQIGTHIGSQTMSDIAVGYSLGNSWRLLSYFSLMSDSLFAHYVQRGIASRNDLIISAAARDADPLNCSGETFGTNGTIENWVTLK